MKNPSLNLVAFILAVTVISCATDNSDTKWRPAIGPLTTPWTSAVTPDHVLPEYPRPLMVRPDWLNLNGLWEYATTPLDAVRPDSFPGRILVPFPLESALSGVMKQLKPDELLWYRRTFQVPRKWRDRHVLLHFGSVDWQSDVFVNGRKVADHKGGYDPFSVDITGALGPGMEQELVVRVWDPTDLGRTDTARAPRQPSGKQRSVPYGTEYSQVSGIWKTVWLEPVPESSISAYAVAADIDRQELTVNVTATGTDESWTVEAVAIDNGKIVARTSGSPAGRLTLRIPRCRLWWPDDPFLYDLKIALYQGNTKIDEVSGYFGMRKISVGKDDKQVTRILLNNKFVFETGLLDQGYWPDGLYTAPTDSALRFDIELMKKLGFNVARKHGKVEPDRWYWWCDKLGLLVWQDMIPKFPAAGYGRNELYTAPEDARQFELEMQRMIKGLRNHPSVIVWTVFNETWGQYDTKRLTKWVKELDPTRLVNSASGCENFGVGDIIDGHQYPGPGPGPTKSWPPAGPDEWQWEVKAMPDSTRAALPGEYGGTFLFFPENSWNKTLLGLKPFTDAGYPLLQTRDELTDRLLAMLETLHGMITSNGISGGLYTQFSDVEVECNGLVTYDRRLVKIDSTRVREYIGKHFR
ncbi:MAG: glycoside hydrolase family 2 TIM barrel-domain containing protein [Bacteroidales bacterium]